MQASALLTNDDVDEKSPSRRTSTFLNVVSLGNVGAGKFAVMNSLVEHLILVLLDIPSKIDSTRALERAMEMRSI
ncbi:Dynamin-2A [Platanthera guangdongensis]|uniref:Dynamin-2A n=1 Tax=Platanthera guangdongensis TaxID=2320717 RepID=A0ABR2LVA2_9ASPA